MFRLYTPVIILQCFCLYHAYKQKVDPLWYMIIVFFPLIGSCIYLYKFLYSARKLETLNEQIKKTVNKTHQIEKLERELSFSDTVHNRIALADKFLEQNYLEDAYHMYKSCHKGMYLDDLDLLLKLVQCSYLLEDYDECKSYGELIERNHDFKATDAKAAYAWSLHYTGEKSKAKDIFVSFDKPFSNYTLRLEYVFYLLDIHQENQAFKILDAMISEFDVMDPHERKMKKHLYKHLLKARKELN